MAFVYYFISVITLASVIFFLRKKKVNYVSAVLFVVIQIGISFYTFRHTGQTDSVYFDFDSLGILLMFVLTILTVATFYHSYLYLRRKPDSPRNESLYFAALILLIASMTGVYFSNHLGVLWALVEATTLCVSALIYHERTTISIEAAWKYVFICSIGISFAFMGILFLSVLASEGGLDTLNTNSLISIAGDMNTTWLKIVFVLAFVGLSAKQGLFPLHTVCVDAHTAAPPPISAFISTTLMNVGFLGIFRFYSIIAQTSALSWARHVLFISGIISIGMAAMQLLRVRHFKRMFAFSSLEQMGIIALGLAAGGLGYYAAVLHIVLHSFAKASGFYHIGQVDSVYHSYWIRETGNYMKLNPFGAIVALLILITVTGIPPSGLFVSELMVFQSLFDSHHYIIAIVALVMITVVIFVFGRNFLHLVYATPNREPAAAPHRINNFENLSQIVLIGLIIYLAFDPPVFFTNLIQASIAVLK